MQAHPKYRRYITALPEKKPSSLTVLLIQQKYVDLAALKLPARVVLLISPDL